MNNNVVFVQARVDSTRLPNKVLLPVNGKPMSDLQIERIMRAERINNIVVVIPDTPTNDVLADHLEDIGVNIYRGSTNNVLLRFIEASKQFKSHIIIRITADCPLIMPKLLDEMIEYFNNHEIDYLSNSLKETFPDGLDIEIFKADILNQLIKLKLSSEEEEHVTLGIYRRPELFKVVNFSNKIDMGKLRWTVDYVEDYEFICRVFSNFKGKETDFDMTDVLSFINQNPDLDNKRSSFFRNISLNSNHNE